MRNLFLIFLLVLIGCSSNSKKAPEDQLDDIDAVSEKKVVEVKYDSRTDYFKGKNEEPQKDVLAVESLARFNNDRLDVTIDSQDPLSQGIGYCYKKDFDRGLAIFKKVYDEYKKHPSFFNQLGTCYYLKGDLIKASLFYNKALDIDKNYAPAYNNLGVLHLKDKDDLRARDAFQKAVSISPFAKTPRFNLAQIYLQYGYADQAITLFSGLSSGTTDGNTGDIDVLIGLANAYLIKGELQKALSSFQTIESRYWQRPDVGLNFSVALKLNGDGKNAVKVFRSVDQGRLQSWTSYYKRVGQFLGGER